MSATRPPTQRFLTLDAMRGLAAVAVAIFHYDSFTVPHGYLAVDFFFALSGFVLMQAYEDRLRRGTGFGRFMEMRLLRLWPLFAVGILIGAARGVQATLRQAPLHLGWGQLAAATALNLAMIPAPFTAALYPVNGVFWSIATELVANAVFAACLWRARTSVLVIVAIAAAGALVIMVRPPIFADSGDGWAGLPLGLVRTAFSFTIGLVIARLARRWPRSTHWAACVSPILLCAILVVATPATIGAAFDLVAIALVFPGLIVLGVLYEPPARLAFAAALLGDLSYPLYATHRPIANGAAFFGKKLALGPWTIIPPFLAVALATAFLVAHYVDKPARRAIGARLALRRSAMPVVA